jgi:hypothetical protein
MRMSEVSCWSSTAADPAFNPCIVVHSVVQSIAASVLILFALAKPPARGTHDSGNCSTLPHHPMILDATCKLDYQTIEVVPAIFILRPRSGWAQWIMREEF